MLETGQTPSRAISITPDIERLIALGAPVAFSVSGGKDGETAVIECMKLLDRMGHKGERVIVNSHLGRIEHQDARARVDMLGDWLGLEILRVVPPNDMIDRWIKRWRNNVDRYINLLCVKVILPWSTPSMRFCTSEEKEAPIASALKKRFPGQTIINVTGVRAEESTARARSEIVKINSRLTRATDNTGGVTWLPIHTYTGADVRAVHDESGFPLSEVYTVHGLSRYSCSFCIMSSEDDLTKSAAIPANHANYRELVGWEISSTFSFQSNRWLGDVAPALLDREAREALADAKRRAAIREQAEARIPEHMLYVKGWPRAVPTLEEAQLMCEVRMTVADALKLSVGYVEAGAVIERYRELMEINRSRCKADSKRNDPADEEDLFIHAAAPASAGLLPRVIWQ